MNPLIASARRIEAHARAYRLGALYALEQPGPGETWRSTAELFTDEAALGALVQRWAARLGTDDRETRLHAASQFSRHYGLKVAALAVALYTLEARVPNLEPDEVLLRTDHEGKITGLAYRTDHFTALADDADAAPSTRVTTRDALRGTLHETLVGLQYGAFVEALARLGPATRTLLWGNLAGTIGVAFHALQHAHPDPTALQEEAARFFERPDSPVHRKVTLLHAQRGVRAVFLCRRTTCCLKYRLPDKGLCDVCSRRPEEEARAILVKAAAHA